MPRKPPPPWEEFRLSARLLRWARSDPPAVHHDSMFPFVNSLLTTVDRTLRPIQIAARKLAIRAVERWLDEAATLDSPGPTSPYRDRYPEWAQRIAAGEHITDIIRAERPELDDAGVEKVRKSFEHAQRLQR